VITLHVTRGLGHGCGVKPKLWWPVADSRSDGVGVGVACEIANMRSGI